MLPEGLEFHNGNGTLCIIGELDPETHTLKEQFCQGVDYGIDYYAMQTLLAPDGRRIMIAWMQNWDTLAYRCNDSGWFAQMSLPTVSYTHLRIKMLVSDQVAETCDACDRTEDLRVLHFFIYADFYSDRKSIKTDKTIFEL